MSSIHVSSCVICPYRKYIYVVCRGVRMVCICGVSWCMRGVSWCACCVRVVCHGVHIVCAWCASVACRGVCVVCHGVHVVCVWCVVVCRRANFWTHLTSLTVTQEMTSQPLSECGVVLWASFWICCVIWLRLKKKNFFLKNSDLTVNLSFYIFHLLFFALNFIIKLYAICSCVKYHLLFKYLLIKSW